MKQVKIIDKVTKIKIDWYSVDDNELKKELLEIKTDSTYTDCDIYVNGQLVNMDEVVSEKSTFELNKEYKLFRQNGDVAERTAKCTGINRNAGAIRFVIIGSKKEDFKKCEIVVLQMKDGNKNNEIAFDMNFKKYLALYSTDAL